MFQDLNRKRAEAFKRRCRDAEIGRHLPTVDDLLRRSPFLENEIEADIQTFAERAIRHVRGDTEQSNCLRDALKAVTVAPWLEPVEQALEALKHVDSKILHAKAASSYTERFLFYAASLGSVKAGLVIARIAFARAFKARDKSLTVDYLTSALGWLTFVQLSHRQLPGTTPYGYQRSEIERNGGLLMHAVSRHFLELKEEEVTQKSAALDHPTEKKLVPDNPLPAGTLVVLSELGNAGINRGPEIEKEFIDIVQKPLPLMACEDIGAVRRALLTEFPYATCVVERLVQDMAKYCFVQLRPTVLVGTPGSGKTRFWRRFLQLLGIPLTIYPCGGVADSTFAGTARHWHTGQPSLPLSLIRQHKVANPAIVLDEIEKSGESRYNGNLHDALLGFLEPDSARHWLDPYVQSAADLSAIIWLATANSLEACSAPLRDRVRAIRFPEPGPEHLEGLAAILMTDIAAEREQDARWMQPLTGVELDALRSVWPGGSVRKLRRYLEGLVDARDIELLRH